MYIHIFNEFHHIIQLNTPMPDEKIIFLFFVVQCIWLLHAQIPDHIYKPNIHSVKLYKYGDIYSYPVIMLNSADQLELHFDDLDADLKNYYYTFQLMQCRLDTGQYPVI